VIDGRMSCDAKQAVLLASYSMQGNVCVYDNSVTINNYMHL